MTDPAPDTQQIEMLKTLLHDSRTERTRLADEVDRLRALAGPAPVGLTEAERERQDREGLTVEPLPPLYHCYVDPDGVLTLWRAYFDNRLRAQSRYVLEQQHLGVVAERDATREALRIAVEGLDEADQLAEAGMDPADRIVAALAAVRELVDLGEKP